MVKKNLKAALAKIKFKEVATNINLSEPCFLPYIKDLNQANFLKVKEAIKRLNKKDVSLSRNSSKEHIVPNLNVGSSRNFEVDFPTAKEPPVKKFFLKRYIPSMYYS